MVEKAAAAGIGERTARQGLANVRAEQAEAAGEAPKPRRRPAKPNPKPAPRTPTLDEVVEINRAVYQLIDKIDPLLVTAAVDADLLDLAAQAKPHTERLVVLARDLDAALGAYLKGAM